MHIFPLPVVIQEHCLSVWWKFGMNNTSFYLGKWKSSAVKSWRNPCLLTFRKFWGHSEQVPVHIHSFIHSEPSKARPSIPFLARKHSTKVKWDRHISCSGYWTVETKMVCILDSGYWWKNKNIKSQQNLALVMNVKL